MSKFTIVAATGCPTGIAHTYMAQEALEQAAKKAGVQIKVETHGQIGVENTLTTQEIKDADAVIIAADKDVHAERFEGKRIIDVSVSKGIKDADNLIQDAINGKGKLRTVTSQNNEKVNNSNNERENDKTSIGRLIYRHLMNGV